MIFRIIRRSAKERRHGLGVLEGVQTSKLASKADNQSVASKARSCASRTWFASKAWAASKACAAAALVMKLGSSSLRNLFKGWMIRSRVLVD